MYVGTTTARRPDHFIILEKGGEAKSVLALMTEKRVKNLIISKELNQDQFLGNPDFKDIFDQIEILHLNKIEIKESQQIYAFKNLRRLEISDCTYKTKEPIDFLQFMKLEEVVMLYSKRFVHLFNHPKLKLIKLNNYNELDFSYPENHVIETLSIEKSKACNWNSLIHLKNLKSLYLIGIPSLKDISFISQLSYLTDIEFSSCKNTLNTIEKLAEVKTLESIFLYAWAILKR